MRKQSHCKLLSFLAVGLLATPLNAFEFDVKSVRVTLSKPQTFHSLVFSPDNDPNTKINFELEPVNNERLGVFFDINGVEVGYAVDVLNDDVQTETEDIILSYRRHNRSRINFNYQTLEGLQANALNLRNESQSQSEFKPSIKSTKIEFLGVHDVYRVYGESVFETFFLNKPQQSDEFGFGLSLLGAWSYKDLKLESSENVIFDPEFTDADIPVVNRIDAQSFSAAVGPLLSFQFANNVQMFAEAKVGKEYFENRNDEEKLKRTGNDTIYSLGAGVAWSTDDEDSIVVLRSWYQEGRHVETVFGDLSYVYYF